MIVNLIGYPQFLFRSPACKTASNPSFISRIARVCTASVPTLDEKKNDISFVEKLYKMGHMSVFEHFTLTYLVLGVSRVCSLQLARHRHISRTEMSFRHVKLPNTMADDFELDNLYNKAFLEQYFVYPPFATTPPFDTKYLSDCYGDALMEYNEMVASGVKREDARFVLPDGLKTNMILTLNLRTLIELAEKRGNNPAAQWEIRDLVNLMCSRFVEVFGLNWSYLFKGREDDGENNPTD